MQHSAALHGNGFRRTREGNSDLLGRAEGKFYTPLPIGRYLAGVVASVRGCSNPERVLSIVDPFCGDGRLVIWLVEALLCQKAGLFSACDIQVWDIDPGVVEECTANVTRFLTGEGVKATVTGYSGDSFDMALAKQGLFDMVITNPPWDVLKPDAREIGGLPTDIAAEYVEGLRATSEMLLCNYATSCPKMRFSGWGVNLARCGAELALRLLKPDGIAGIVSPASLMADHVSRDLRQWLLEQHTVLDMAYFPAEARLFRGVDQPCMTLVASRKRVDIAFPELTVFDRHLGLVSQTTLPIDASELARDDFVVPLQLSAEQHRVLDHCKRFPTVSGLETDGVLWLGRELDETNYRDYLSANGAHPFLKGRMVGRYAIIESPTFYVGEHGPRIPDSVSRARLVWRDVARPARKRRMHAALIPPGWVTGNSLNVAYAKSDNPDLLLSLLAVFNSLVFEFQIRAYLGTAHMSLGAVRKAHVPDLTDGEVVRNLAALAGRVSENPERFEVQIEVAVAKLLGLDRADLAAVLGCFPKLSGHEMEQLLQSKLWSTCDPVKAGGVS